MPLNERELDGLRQSVLRALSVPLDPGDRIDVARNIALGTLKLISQLVSLDAKDAPDERRNGEVPDSQ